MPIYKGVDLNAALTPPDWGPKELAALQLIIDGQVTDCYQGSTVHATGHKHHRFYDGYGSIVIRADNTGNSLYVGEEGVGYAQTVIQGGSSRENAIVLRTPGNDHFNIDTWTGANMRINSSSALDMTTKLRDSRGASHRIQVGTDDVMLFNTSDDLIDIGRAIGGTRPIPVRVLGDFHAGNSFNLRGEVGGSPDQGEILVNAYFDGTDYRRKYGGSATRMYSSGGSTMFFRDGGDAPDTVITWGQPVLTISDGTIGFGTGSPGVNISNWGRVYFYGLPQGTTQSGAGASAGELWVDTDDDYRVKMGV